MDVILKEDNKPEYQRINHENVWEYYEDLNTQDFQAKCLVCKHVIRYVHLGKSAKHGVSLAKKITDHLIADHEDEILAEIKENILEYYCTTNYICFFCDQQIPIEDLFTHLFLIHKYEVKKHEAKKQFAKYYERIEGDHYKVKCKKCYKEMHAILNGNVLTSHRTTNYHMEQRNLMELENIPSKITNNFELQQFYNIYSNVAACKLCVTNQFQVTYLDLTKFIQHMANDHPNEYDHEIYGFGTQFPYMFYSSISEERLLQCSYCTVRMPWSVSDLFEHLTQHATLAFDYVNAKQSERWVWKYCTTDITKIIEKVKCTRCIEHKEILLDIKFWVLNDHIVKEHLNKPSSTYEGYTDEARLPETQSKRRKYK